MYPNKEQVYKKICTANNLQSWKEVTSFVVAEKNFWNFGLLVSIGCPWLSVPTVADADNAKQGWTSSLYTCLGHSKLLQVLNRYTCIS